MWTEVQALGYIAKLSVFLKQCEILSPCPCLCRPFISILIQNLHVPAPVPGSNPPGTLSLKWSVWPPCWRASTYAQGQGSKKSFISHRSAGKQARSQWQGGSCATWGTSSTRESTTLVVGAAERWPELWGPSISMAKGRVCMTIHGELFLEDFGKGQERYIYVQNLSSSSQRAGVSLFLQ